MEFQKVLVSLKNSHLFQLPLHQNPREITVDPSGNCEVKLICYRMQNKEKFFAYLLKNINPISSWYEMSIRDGDRLIRLNGEDVTRMSYEDIYSIMIEKKLPFTCQVVCHPELYIQCGTTSIDQEQNNPIRSQRLIDDNMYEYLTEILRPLLDYRPNEPHQLFKKEQQSSFDIETESNSFAQRQLTLLSSQAIIEGHPEETMRNMLEVNALFERIGIGLNKDEIYWVWLSMKTLLNEKPDMQKLRFWGKVFGLKNDYYIAEADFDAFDNLEPNDLEFLKYQEALAVEEENETDDERTVSIDQKISLEPIGSGANQKIFYVSSGINQSFVQLPLVTPQQIELSRKIQQFFIGDLQAPIRSDSHFPGLEKHRLRAQIQRISAGTQIAPKNYFTNVEEQFGEDTIEPKIKFEMNNALEDLAQSNGQYWIHCVSYLNRQAQNDNSSSSIDQDITIDGLHPAWSAGIASTLIPEHTLVYVRSNRWPGAFTVADRHHFENVYIGWGVKNFIEDHQANMIDIYPAKEYQFELMEIDDPTIDDENELFKSAILLSPDENEEFEIE